MCNHVYGAQSRHCQWKRSVTLLESVAGQRISRLRGRREMWVHSKGCQRYPGMWYFYRRSEGTDWLTRANLVHDKAIATLQLTFYWTWVRRRFLTSADSRIGILGAETLKSQNFVCAKLPNVTQGPVKVGVDTATWGALSGQERKIFKKMKARRGLLEAFTKRSFDRLILYLLCYFRDRIIITLNVCLPSANVSRAESHESVEKCVGRHFLLSLSSSHRYAHLNLQLESIVVLHQAECKGHCKGHNANLPDLEFLKFFVTCHVSPMIDRSSDIAYCS